MKHTEKSNNLDRLLESLRVAILGDRNLFVRAKLDPELQPVREPVDRLLDQFVQEARTTADRHIQRTEKLLTILDRCDVAEEKARLLMAKARKSYSDDSYFGYTDASRLAEEAEVSAAQSLLRATEARVDDFTKAAAESEKMKQTLATEEKARPKPVAIRHVGIFIGLLIACYFVVGIVLLIHGAAVGAFHTDVSIVQVLGVALGLTVVISVPMLVLGYRHRMDEWSRRLQRLRTNVSNASECKDRCLQYVKEFAERFSYPSGGTWGSGHVGEELAKIHRTTKKLSNAA